MLANALTVSFALATGCRRAEACYLTTRIQRKREKKRASKEDPKEMEGL